MNTEKVRDFLQFKEYLLKVLINQKPSKKLRKLYEDEVLQIHLPELADCWGVEQDLRFHKDTIFEHCVKTCDYVPPTLWLRLAALCHDLGKLPTRNVYQECLSCDTLLDFGNPNIPLVAIKDLHLADKCPSCEGELSDFRISFHKHEIASTQITKQILDRFELNHLRKPVLNLIANHMYNFTREWGEKGLRNFIERTGITLSDLKQPEKIPLFILRRAERKSRGIRAVTQRQLDFERKLKEFLESE